MRVLGHSNSVQHWPSGLALVSSDAVCWLQAYWSASNARFDLYEIENEIRLLAERGSGAQGQDVELRATFL